MIKMDRRNFLKGAALFGMTPIVLPDMYFLKDYADYNFIEPVKN